VGTCTTSGKLGLPGAAADLLPEPEFPTSVVHGPVRDFMGQGREVVETD
jgi:hypothetical protein